MRGGGKHMVTNIAPARQPAPAILPDARWRNFASLSVKDLLEARDLYRVQLANRQNVVGTAIGRYLIRASDPWPSWAGRPATADGAPAAGVKDARTFANSEVRPYSWPCVLVLVKRWIAASDFRT